MAKQSQPPLGPPAQPAATFCKQPNGVIRIILTGDSINLEGFGYPDSGFAVHYETKPSPIPFYPDNSSGLSTAEEFHPDPTNGTWNCFLLDGCDDALLLNRTIVIWFKYESAVDVHWLVEVFDIKIPICGDISNCP